MDAGAAIALTGEATHAVFDALVDDMYQLDFLIRHLFHSFQEGTGDVQGVAFLPFGTAVENKCLHSE